jgi:hypothetical protein
MRKLVLWLVINAIAGYAIASPVLISVDLPTIESKRTWRQLKIPTYELMGNTAITKVEGSRIAPLINQGYQITVLDQQPDISKYMVIADRGNKVKLADKPIWRDEELAIIKPASKEIYLRPEYAHRIRPMNPEPLGDRFWKSVITKYVPLKNIPYDPFIQSLVDQVNADSITAYIQRLQDFGGRYSWTPSNYAASEWICNKFSEWAIPAVFDSVYIYYDEVRKGWTRSAIGTIHGSDPKVIIASGHMDTSPSTSPGADDDASGVASAMEMARILKNHSWEATLKFAGWDGEESAAYEGSGHYSKTADSTNESILGVINMDMLGYMNDSIMNGEVWHYFDCSTWLAELFIEMGGLYSPAMNCSLVISGVPCDQLIFEYYGYPAITAIEPDPFSNPYIHGESDSLCYLTPEMYLNFTKISLATMAYLSKTAATVESLEVFDPGNGNELLVAWAENKEPYVTQYRIYWGRESGVYNDSCTIDTAGYLLPNLKEDSTYYICVRAITLEGYISVMAKEVSGIPRNVPVTPSGFGLTPMIMSIKLDWQRNTELDLAGYRIFRKIENSSWDSINTDLMNDTTLYIDSVNDRDARYWYRIRAYDSSGNASNYTDSLSAYTYKASELIATPGNDWIKLEWSKSYMPNAAGYLIYRKINNGSYDSLNQAVLKDTTYIDTSLLGANKYYYIYCIYDSSGFASRLSDSVYGRPITLDQGVLLVDETNNWTSGSFPRDAQQDSFYEYILSDYKHQPYDYGTATQKPILADLGPYSAVVWLADDYVTMLASGAMNDIRSYLGYGGKVWFAGWKPSQNIRNSTLYPDSFETGEVMYDCFGIGKVELSGSSDSVKQLIGLSGYPDIAVDTLKYPSSVWGKTFRSVEAVVPAGEFDTIYSIDLKNNGSAFEGRACAVRDSGRVVYFGFPVYFMDREDARLAAQHVMAEFGEPNGVAERKPAMTMPSFKLYQNVPNPFRVQTTIGYQLPKAGHVSLKIYNIAGQLVRTLSDSRQESGYHKVDWNGKDDWGKILPTGVYLYRVSVPDGIITGKSVILR